MYGEPTVAVILPTVRLSDRLDTRHTPYDEDPTITNLFSSANRFSEISFHQPSRFGTDASSYTEEEKKKIQRKKGIFSTNEFARSEKPKARHHLKIFFNDYGQARLFYKINGNSIKFIQNRK